MKYTLLLFFCLIFVGCNTKGERKAYSSSSKFAMKCEIIGNSLMRCENKEAICYLSQYTLGRVMPNCSFLDTR